MMTVDTRHRTARIGGADRILTEREVRAFVAEQLAAIDADGRSVCVLVPDGTRSCPLPLMVGAVHRALHGRVSRLTVRNYEWWKPETFAHLGTIPSVRIEELSEGRITGDVEVLLNRAVVDHDIALVVGPVLPHEVAGMSGGNKYFFPGVVGQKIIDVSHRLGALITSAEIIGTTGLTPVRALINDGAALIPALTYVFCVVTAEASDAARGGVDSDHASALRSISFGGGEVILYAPHIREIAASHPDIHEIGYHCRDYFVKQWEAFQHVHWGVLAHSTHLRAARGRTTR